MLLLDHFRMARVFTNIGTVKNLRDLKSASSLAGLTGSVARARALDGHACSLLRCPSSWRKSR